ncbi:hypothetical protein FZC84_15455 [Rossellomorea vietnamensis]|uniref:Uncharacterized protein n=1 Tax=Rossellomorea vietnamensis TaxID=218284 RepID=A0A5D4M8P3_9BACI|nr:hypothetical protein [Rossellomorea vietnamensis]TYR98304.1 hypothetical protein FZC84_15455 [Rossellomorea vietnamensis]
MKQLGFIFLFSLLIVLSACSGEAVKEDEVKVDDTAASADREEIKIEENSFEEFGKLSEQEQKDIIIQKVNSLGYDNDLALKLHSFITDEDSDIPDYYKDVDDYVSSYIQNSSMESNKLDDSAEEDEDELPMEVAQDISDNRAEAIKNVPLFGVSEVNQLMILGVEIGQSLEYWKGILGESDHVNRILEGGDHFNDHHFIIDGQSLSNEDLNYYQLIIRVDEQSPDSISEVSLIIENKDGVQPSIVLPDEFVSKLQGEVFVHSPTNFVFTNSDENFQINFLHHTWGTQVLNILSTGNDFKINAESWDNGDLQVWDSNKVIFDPITLGEASEILSFERIVKQND